MPGAAWEAHEDDAVRRYYPRRTAAAKAALLAAVPGRSWASVRRRAGELGVHRKRPWSDREKHVLQLEWHELSERGLRAKLPGRTWSSIRAYATALGLPQGVPQGCEFLWSAARRLGYEPDSLRRIFAAHGVRVRRLYRCVRTPTEQVQPRHYVEIDAATAAVVAHQRTEVVSTAARARGVSATALRYRLRRLGALGPPRGVGPGATHQRVSSALIDAALAGHRPRAKAVAA